jgi:hypothetical protein
MQIVSSVHVIHENIDVNRLLKQLGTDGTITDNHLCRIPQLPPLYNSVEFRMTEYESLTVVVG